MLFWVSVVVLLGLAGLLAPSLKRRGRDYQSGWGGTGAGVLVAVVLLMLICRWAF